ncbi:Zinc finger protein Xfin [Escovopsis weberi]|uniref:Zinc finger protein Xfin n=1 Tax=Escovopsis weberi TaxID=150374 RepID=A0A0M9VS72_ESCWE|nr:Zinc finger protein Xfin [Escovopsis weberi]
MAGFPEMSGMGSVPKRIHTGVRPHVDSSSLARHRRTHSGKRPYKCPYADCQKTFTRRTTLTRHQNHHSGTIEEAAAATAAALAASRAKTVARSEGDHLSNQGSPLSTPSPGHQAMSMSPSIDLSGAGGMNRHHGEFHYMPQGGSLPPHLRVGSPNSTSSAGSYANGIRPTSHPVGYGPPPTLEPNLEQHPAAAGSAGSSPHMSNVGWQSPSHMASPSHTGGSYVYPDPDGYPPNPSMNQMYYGAPQMRRPQSAEPGLVHMA